jgi:hypothetical protein
MARQHFDTVPTPYLTLNDVPQEVTRQKEAIVTHPHEAKALIMKILLDAGSQPDRMRDEFGEFGTRMHDLIDSVSYTLPLNFTPLGHFG